MIAVNMSLHEVCTAIFRLSGGDPDDEEHDVGVLEEVVRRYDTVDERDEDDTLIGFVYSMLCLVAKHGTQEEKNLANTCREELSIHLYTGDVEVME